MAPCFVLRRPPLGMCWRLRTTWRASTASSLRWAPPPCRYRRAFLGLCEDVEVNGAPFYVMGFVDGVVLDGPACAETLGADLRRPAVEHLFDGVRPPSLGGRR